MSQTLDAPIEVIVINDGCTDGSMNVVRKHPLQNIRIIEQTNQGCASARNRGYEVALGEYFALIDADDYWDKDFLKRTYTFLKNNPNVDAVAIAQILHTVSSSSVSPTNWKQFNGPFVIDNFWKFWTKYQFLCNGNVLVKTELIKKAGYMREELKGTEDWEHWFLISTFAKWAFIPEVLFICDGKEASRDQGWMNKMMIRWKAAPSISDWEKRIRPRLPQSALKDYFSALGVVARTLIYSQLLSGRIDFSYNEILSVRSYLQRDKIGKLMILASYSKFTWKLLYKLLYYREKHRKF